jgi:uncharacterized protein (DUF1778 family)
MAKPLIRRRPNYSVRLSLAERRLLEAAASHRGEYLSEFVRNSALSAATRVLAGERRNDFEKVSEILPRALSIMGYDLDDLLAANHKPAA